MRISRVYAAQDLAPGSRIELQPASAAHLLKVLRLDSGASIALFNGDGREFSATLIRHGRQSLQAQVGDQIRQEDQARLFIRLLLGISKGERMDFAIQKSVELGVSAIHPLFTERSMVQLKGERLDRRINHWRGVIISACEQSGRCRLAQLLEPMDFAAGLRLHTDADCRLVLHHRSETSLHGLRTPVSGVDLLVGPEGGLSAQELQLAGQHNFRPLRLGPRVMRTETAPLAALAAIQTLWGDYS